MTPDERQLIDGLFERLRTLAGTERDGEAEAYINQLIRQQPYAPYLLAQTAIVNEHALSAANARVQELEAQLKNQPAKSSGSFLGGLFGGGQPAAPARPTSVPVTSSRPPQYAQQPASPWGGQQGYGGQQPGYGAPPPQQQASGGGGFLRSAMTTAAGVAGGMILADSIRGMMGGGHHGGMFGGDQSAAQFGTKPDLAAQDAADDAAQDATFEDDNNDPGTTDAAFEDSSGGGWDTEDI